MRKLKLKPEERIVRFKFYDHMLFINSLSRRKYIHYVDIDGNNNPSICPTTWNKECPICQKVKKLWNANGNYGKYLRCLRELYCVEIISDSKHEVKYNEKIFIQLSNLLLFQEYFNYITYLGIDDVWSGSVKLVCHDIQIGVDHFVDYKQDSKFIFKCKEYPIKMSDDFWGL